MIKNQKQAAITREKLANLKADRDTFISNKKEYDEFTFMMGVNSLDSLIKDLETDITDYEYLVNGVFHFLQPKSLDDIPNILISARLAQKMSQKDLADIVGIQEQQIQRYELTDYETASRVRISEVSKALGIKFYFEKIVLINSTFDEEIFQYPDGITSEQVKKVEEKTKKSHSLIFN